MTYKLIGDAELISEELEKGLINKFTLTVRSTDMRPPSYESLLEYCMDYLNISSEDIVGVEAKLYPINKYSKMYVTYRPAKLAEINRMDDGIDKLNAALKYLNMDQDVSMITRDDPQGPYYRAWNVEFKTDSLRGRTTGEVVRFVTFFFHDYLRMIVAVSYEHF